MLGVLTVQLLQGLRDVRRSPFAGGEPRREVVIGPTPRCDRVVFGRVDGIGVGNDLCGDPLCFLADPVVDRLADFEAFAAILVPSIDTIPTLTIPAAAHNRRTWANRSANPSWCSARNLAIVEWSGPSWPHNTRNATWSTHNRSIRRDDRSPTA
jgi:hypothetical protein